MKLIFFLSEKFLNSSNKANFLKKTGLSISNFKALPRHLKLANVIEFGDQNLNLEQRSQTLFRQSVWQHYQVKTRLEPGSEQIS